MPEQIPQNTNPPVPIPIQNQPLSSSNTIKKFSKVPFILFFVFGLIAFTNLFYQAFLLPSLVPKSSTAVLAIFPVVFLSFIFALFGLYRSIGIQNMK